MTLRADDHPELLKAVKAALAKEKTAPAPVGPDHSPWGHVRLATSGGGWTCGLCGRAVVANGFDEWRHT